MADKKLQLVIEAKNNATKEVAKVNNEIDKSNKLLSSMIDISKATGVALGALSIKLGFDAVKSASIFSKEMANVSTLVDTNKESMVDMKNEILDLSKRLPVALSDLTSSLYDVRSAGISADGSMKTLESSAILATAGLGTTKEATNLLTSAINAFGLDANNSGQVADVFFKAVKSGKTTISELAIGFGQVAPLANSINLQFEDLIGTTSAMTTSGLSASIAYTQIRAILTALLKPTTDMDEALDKAGLTSEKLKQTIGEKGLTATINILSEAVDGNDRELAKMFGSVEALNGVQMLLNDTGESATDIIEDMTKGENKLIEAFDKQNEESYAQYQILKNQLSVELIKLGVKVLPEILNVVDLMKYFPDLWQDWADRAKNVYKQISFLNPQMKALVDFGSKVYDNWDDLTKIAKKLASAIRDIDIGDLFDLGFSKRATGGSVMAGRPYLVGENGPEIFYPSGSGSIEKTTTNNNSQTVNNYFDFSGAVVGDKESLVKEIEASLNRKLELNNLGAY